MKLSMIDKREREPMFQRFPLAAAVVLVVTVACGALATTAVGEQKSFSSPDEAVKAAIAATRTGAEKELVAIFGPGSQELVSSGDPAADQQRRAAFLNAYDDQNRLVTDGAKAVLLIGNNDWPFPIPLMEKESGWVFHTAEGREEILNRRIGRNELDTVQVVLAYVDAQREYARKDRDGDGLLEYAQKFRSSAGKKDGLYWEARAGEEESPLGPLIARAVKEGYPPSGASDQPSPFHGYYLHILTAQDRSAPGGAYSYLVKDSMVGGFALVAYPAEYGNSGVVTFIVNHDGKVFQKDLGKKTATVAQRMKDYNPDKTWTEVEVKD